MTIAAMSSPGAPARRRYPDRANVRSTVVRTGLEGAIPFVVAPAKERVKNTKPRHSGARGAAREPEIHEHRTANIWDMLVFLGSGLGPSDRPGMT
jgi:hypothetical protein